ncbi:putative methyltransferase C9orf114 homolog [Tribolium madens]|uniref:putative methyltransferase C9orf114 homolog n=1 Tax=Tribolium madens TaxID=41895 RepID=UPI001CF73D0B|nr:putative methyltransferase C9orf114 homolog [Tribolium madens]
MGRVKSDQKQKSWSEINKTRKEEKRKWKEQNLVRKMEKQKVKEAPKLEQNNGRQEEPPTVSIAVPGSILETAQSPELRAYLSGQIARAACIFQVDEIVVFDDFGDEATAKKAELEDNYGLKTMRESCVQLGRILQYMECPQYLRKHFFPIHNHLKFCGILNPLNAPHHLSKDEEFEYREGVVLNKPVKPGRGSIVNVGLLKEVHVDKLLTPGIRCTVKLLPQQESSKKLKGVVVAPSIPKIETGVYWGYTIRLANSLSKVFSQSPYKDGYDLTIGTSDKGTSIDEFQCPTFKHAIIVFGGVQGLETALESDNVLNVDDPKFIFDHYLNTLPNQGSKTIRTEEAVLVTLSALRPKFNYIVSCAE